MKEFTPERYEPAQYKASPIAYEHWHRYMSVSALVKDKVVLDIACGNGYGTNYLSSYAKKIIGIDIDSLAINLCKEQYSNDSIEFNIGSVSSIPLDNNAVDIVVSFETIEHVSVEMQKEFMQEVIRVLKPGGFLIVSTPNLDSHQYTDIDNDFHIKEFKHDEFIGFCKKHFNFVSVYGQSIVTGSILSQHDKNELDLYKVKYNKLGIPKEIKKKIENKFIIAICSIDEPKDLKGSILWDVADSYMVETHNYANSIYTELTKVQREVKKQNEAISESARTLEIYANSLLEDRDNLNAAYIAERDNWISEREELQKQNEAISESARTLEIYANSLLEDRDNLNAAYIAERDKLSFKIEYLEKIVEKYQKHWLFKYFKI
jgi:O-antigen biosynthesis protein